MESDDGVPGRATEAPPPLPVSSSTSPALPSPGSLLPPTAAAPNPISSPSPVVPQHRARVTEAPLRRQRWGAVARVTEDPLHWRAAALGRRCPSHRSCTPSATLGRRFLSHRISSPSAAPRVTEAPLRRRRWGAAPVTGALIGLAGGAPAMLSSDCKACGYNFEGIQRLVSGGRKWIAITPPAQDQRRGGNCHWCNQHTKRHDIFCCMRCRLLSIPTGGGRPMAQNLVDMAPQFGQPVHMLNRMCRLCLLSFCSTSCGDHLLHHEGHPNAAAAGLVMVQHEHGWALVDVADVPNGFADDVQVLNLDGRVLYPIHRRPLHQAGGDPGAHPCGRPGCWEAVHGAALFCSLQCRHPA